MDKLFGYCFVVESLFEGKSVRIKQIGGVDIGVDINCLFLLWFRDH